MKYLEHEVTFREIPDEITLCINITNCPYRCPGCHSPQLWEDVGEELTLGELHKLIDPIKEGITCVSFMGGDKDPEYINHLALLIQTEFGKRVAWYSGSSILSDKIDISRFNYIKLGPYIEEFGGLDSPKTNQKMFKIEDLKMIDITSKFWNKNTHNYD